MLCCQSYQFNLNQKKHEHQGEDEIKGMKDKLDKGKALNFSIDDQWIVRF